MSQSSSRDSEGRVGASVFKLLALAAMVCVVIAIARSRMGRVPRRWTGVRYRLLGRRPDPNVDDNTLADRVRSSLGPIEKQLDVPHVHVMAENHVVLLHGDVEWEREAATITRAVRAVSGVRDVESHLHIGLLRSDTRPSAGRGHASLK